MKSAALASVAILAGDEWDSSMAVEGHKAADGEDMQAFMNALSPGYFETMKIPILEGRDFRPGDAKERADGRHRQPAASRNTSFPGRARSAGTSALAAAPTPS